MDTIKNYIENLFQNYPLTYEVEKAKENLLTLMEDKYTELKLEGKTENEAIGIVISEFGNIEEITSELNISQNNPENETRLPIHNMGLNEVKSYLSRRKQYGTKIAVGVVLLILSPVTAGILDVLSDLGYVRVNIADAIGFTVLFLLVAAAVCNFITTGLSSSKDDELEKHLICLDYSTKSYVEELYNKYQPVFSKKIVLGVLILILGVLPGAISSELFVNELLYISDFASYSLFFFAAVGVYCLITAYTLKNSFDLLLAKGDYEKRNKSENKVLAVISAIYWPVTTVIYLGWSFLTHQWGISWIVWPIAGILYGGIAAVCELLKPKHFA